MAHAFEGLENKLNDVHVGDLLYLETTKGDKVAGFVADFTPTRVTLSHEDPANQERWGTYRFPHVTIGNRSYLLRFFETYRVLSTKAPTLIIPESDGQS